MRPRNRHFVPRERAKDRSVRRAQVSIWTSMLRGLISRESSPVTHVPRSTSSYATSLSYLKLRDKRHQGQGDKRTVIVRLTQTNQKIPIFGSRATVELDRERRPLSCEAWIAAKPERTISRGRPMSFTEAHGSASNARPE
jgi:hypothetical protein